MKRFVRRENIEHLSDMLNVAKSDAKAFQADSGQGNPEAN
jgi:hypothetical protein